MSIKAVVFDLDNTLYDYDACNALAEKKLFRAIADELCVPEETAAVYLKKAKANIKEQLGSEVAASHNRLLYMQNICEQAGANPFKFAMYFYSVYWDTMLESMILFDYVNPLIEKLKSKGIKIGILTDLTAYIQYRKIEKLGIGDKIDCFVSSEEAGAEKPSGLMFDLMIKKLNVSPEEVLMIGDSEKKDIIGAKAIGMQTMKYCKGVTIDIDI